MWAHQFIVIRHVGSDELRICKVVSGYKPQMQDGYTWGGPYDTKKAAENAVRLKNDQLRRQLYPEEQESR